MPGREACPLHTELARPLLTGPPSAPRLPAFPLLQKVVSDVVSSASVLERLQNFQHKDVNWKDLVRLRRLSERSGALPEEGRRNGRAWGRVAAAGI